jgi:glucose-1-phosphate cytidylyltransferase
MNGHRSTILERPAQRDTRVAKVCIMATDITHVGDRNGQPAPMVEVGGRPLLWHNLMHFAAHGCREFVIGLGQGGDRVKRYLLDYANLSCDLRLSLDREAVEHAGGARPDWSVDLIDVSDGAVRLRSHLGDEPFILSTGDSVSDVDAGTLLEFHRAQGRPATLIAVRPQARFGTLLIEDGRVLRFAEKPQQEEGWVPSGLLVLDPSLLDGPGWDADALTALAVKGGVAVYRHGGFWHCVETLRDKQVLDEQWQAGRARWKTWA